MIVGIENFRTVKRKTVYWLVFASAFVLQGCNTQRADSPNHGDAAYAEALRVEKEIRRLQSHTGKGDDHDDKKYFELTNRQLSQLLRWGTREDIAATPTDKEVNAIERVLGTREGIKVKGLKVCGNARIRARCLTTNADDRSHHCFFVKENGSWRLLHKLSWLSD